MVIGHLRSQSFLSFRHWLSNSEAGNEATCIASFHHWWHGSIMAFVKFYPYDNGKNRGLANEIVGHLITGALGIGQPNPAFIADIPLDRLRFTGMPSHWRWLADVAKARGTYPAFCTQLSNASTPWHSYSGDADAIRNDVKAWPGHLPAITLDDTIANIDRHWNNLLRTGKSDYLLIDNGQLVAPVWKKSDLDQNAEFTNLLLKRIYKTVPKDIGNAMIHFAESHPDAWSACAEEIGYWLPKVLPAGDAIAFDEFIRRRAQSAAKRLIGRYSLC